METGKRIREARKAKGLTQKQLADIMGIAEITVRQYEGDKRTPTIDQLEKIAESLGIDFASLLGIGTLIDGVYTQEEMQKHIPKSTAEQIAQAYEKATPPVQRTVEVALEPFMEKARPDKGSDDPQ